MNKYLHNRYYNVVTITRNINIGDVQFLFKSEDYVVPNVLGKTRFEWTKQPE